jgi:hypothetical protein
MTLCRSRPAVTPSPLRLLIFFVTNELMNAEESKAYAKGLIDLANLVAAALIFGQFVSGNEMSFGAMGLGALSMLALYGVAHKFYATARLREQHHG